VDGIRVKMQTYKYSALMMTLHIMQLQTNFSWKDILTIRVSITVVTAVMVIV
jgi:hypothetical protein